MSRNDSYIKSNGTIRKSFEWKEIPMVHPEGRCIQLNFNKTDYLETTLIFKFNNTKFNYSGILEMTITGKLDKLSNIDLNLVLP